MNISEWGPSIHNTFRGGPLSNLPQDDRETRKAVEDFSRMPRQKSKEERAALLDQARDEALAEELAEAREQSEREAAALREELAYDPAKERDRARETAKSAALLLIMSAAHPAADRGCYRPHRYSTDLPGLQVTQTLRPYYNSTPTGVYQPEVFIPTSPPGVTPEVDQLFRPYYDHLRSLGDECSIGDAISPASIGKGCATNGFSARS